MRRLKGSIERPRLVVHRSNRHIYAQVVNDVAGLVLTGASTLTEDIRTKKTSGPRERARLVGRLIAEKALKNKVTKVVFDRKGYKYHGNVKELAEGAREGGLEF